MRKKIDTDGPTKNTFNDIDGFANNDLDGQKGWVAESEDMHTTGNHSRQLLACAGFELNELGSGWIMLL